MKKFIFLLLLINLGVHLQSQINYYVSPSGDDSSDGSWNNPWQSLQYAMDNATPGSTVSILAGTYNEKVYLNVSGSANQWITFKNYENDEVIIDGTGWNDPALCEIYDQAYVRIEGLHFTNNKQLDAMGIFIEGFCHHIEILNCEISEVHFSADPNAPVNENTNSQPLIVYGVEENAAITDLLISGNEIHDCRTGYSEALAINGNVDGFEVSHNEVHHISNIGIDIIGHEGTCLNPNLDQARNGLISWNTAHHCQSPYASAAGIYVDGAKNILIENNIVHTNQWGIEVSCENIGKTSSDILLRNNFIYNNSSAGIQMGGYDYPNGSGKVTHCQILNNSLFNNSTLNAYDGELTLTYSEDCEVVNNVFYANNLEAQLFTLEDVEEVPPGLILNSNCWYHPDGISNSFIYWNGQDFESLNDFTAATGFEMNGIFIDPLLVSVNTAVPDLHLQSTSPLINAADQSYANLAGSFDIDQQERILDLLDMGADEFQESAGIKQVNTILNLHVFPNPTSDYFYADLNQMPGTSIMLFIFDSKGCLVKQMKASNTNGQLRVNISELNPGQYVVRIRSKDTNYISKLFVR